jgi:predicted amidohydrolase YtcJ
MSVIYPAKNIITMNDSVPYANAVAVQDDRVIAVGDTDELARDYDGVVDARYKDKVILPGFVEAHAHSGAGGIWKYTYVGFFPRQKPDGTFATGCESINSIVATLQNVAAQTAENEPIIGWGLEPMYLSDTRLSADDLDRISTTRPVLVAHTSLHAATMNHRAMEMDGLQDLDSAGVVRDAQGKATGEVIEFEALGRSSLFMLFNAVMDASEDSIRAFGDLAKNAGITTVTDLLSTDPLQDDKVALWKSIVEDTRFPARVSQFLIGEPWRMGGLRQEPDAAAKRIAYLAEHVTGKKMIYGGIKLMLDGSIQGFTACLQEPGYYKQPGHVGIWNDSPEGFFNEFLAYHRAGLLVHCHCNGDAATQLFLDTLNKVFAISPRLDHRHTVQHSQLSTPAQYRQMSAMGVCANIFANHIWYWGDQHAELTVGPDRANRMNAARTALDSGVSISFHSDCPVTPMDPLRTVMYACLRKTPSGRVLGAGERISVKEGLKAVTLGAAYQLKLDHLVGSIEPGKYADFAVLSDDPLAAGAEGLKDIQVLGTVVGGEHFPVSAAK